jgi:hypothetical protein
MQRGASLCLACLSQQETDELLGQADGAGDFLSQLGGVPAAFTVGRAVGH